MSTSVQISQQDWQMLLDLHDKLGGLLFEVTSLMQAVAFTATSAEMAKDAARLFTELEPVARQIFVEDPPFGIRPTE